MVSGGAGIDTIVQASTDGRDLVDGGAGADTYRLNGTAEAETFTVYAMSGGQNAGLAASLGTVFQASTEIVITRTVGGVTTVVAELDNIEEIQVNTLAVSANDGNGVPNGGVNGGDTIQIVGDFDPTSLNFSTITIDGSAADDTRRHHAAQLGAPDRLPLQRRQRHGGRARAVRRTSSRSRVSGPRWSRNSATGRCGSTTKSRA